MAAVLRLVGTNRIGGYWFTTDHMNRDVRDVDLQ